MAALFVCQCRRRRHRSGSSVPCRADADLRPGAKDHPCAGRSGAARSVRRSRSMTATGERRPTRIVADPKKVERDLARLVLSVIELLRQLLERQAIRRVENGSLSEDEIECLGETLLKLETRMAELKTAFGLGRPGIVSGFGPASRSGFGVRIGPLCASPCRSVHVEPGSSDDCRTAAAPAQLLTDPSAETSRLRLLNVSGSSICGQ